MCQFKHEEKRIKLLPCQSKTEQAEQKPVTVKKIKGISLINAKTFSQEVEKRASFMILTTRKAVKEPWTLIPSEDTLVITDLLMYFLKTSQISYH